MAAVAILATGAFFCEYLPPFKRVHLFSDIEVYHYPLQRYALPLAEGRPVPAVGSRDLLRHYLCRQHHRSAFLPADVADVRGQLGPSLPAVQGAGVLRFRAHLAGVRAVLSVAARPAVGVDGERTGRGELRVRRVHALADRASGRGARAGVDAAGIVGHRRSRREAQLASAVEDRVGFGVVFSRRLPSFVARVLQHGLSLRTGEPRTLAGGSGSVRGRRGLGAAGNGAVAADSRGAIVHVRRRALRRANCEASSVRCSWPIGRT